MHQANTKSKQINYSWSRIKGMAEKLAKEYYPFVPKEIADNDDSYRNFLREVYQIAYLAFAEAERTWDSAKGASFESWVYFYLRLLLSQTFSVSSATDVCEIKIKPEHEEIILNILSLPASMEVQKIILSSHLKRRLNNFLETYGYHEKVVSQKLEVRKSSEALVLKTKAKRYFKTVSVEALSENCGYEPSQDFKESDESPEQALPELRKYIASLIACLPCKHRKVLAGLYGLCGHPHKTHKEIATELSYTEERIRQIEKEAILYLRSVCQDKFFRFLLKK